MNKLRSGTVPAVLFFVLILLSGCKDFFHPEGPKDNRNTSTGPFTVTFDADDGSPSTQTRLVDKGASVGSSNMPSATKSGYNFDSWYTQRDGGGTRFSDTTTVTGDITVYAKWTALSSTQYTVTFDADGGSPSTQTRQVNSGASVGSSNMPSATKSGYSFGGWYTQRNGGGTRLSDTTTVTGDITVYARWASTVGSPAGLNVTGQTANSISLSWSAVSGATSYKVYKGTNSGDVNEYVAETQTPSVSCTVTGLTANTSYYFAVSAVNQSGEGVPSAAVPGTTSAVTLTKPAGLRVNGQTANSITLSWQTVSGAEGYRVSRSASSAGSYTPVNTTASTSYEDNTGLTPATTYYYEVVAYSGQNESDAATVSGTTLSSGGTIAPPPPAPTGLVVSDVTSGSVSLSWNSAANAVSYDIYRGNTKDGEPAKIGNSGAGISYTDSTASAGVMYYYSVKAVNSSAASSYSNKAFACAAAHYALPTHSSSYKINLPAGSKHYYRLVVSAGQSYTITWENGSSQNANGNVECSAWQNDGTAIFTNAYNGYTSAKAFTATAAGYVTVEVKNTSGSNSYDYQIYYH